jgi:hypothetical protein
MGVVALRADAFALGKGRIVDPPLIVSALAARLAGENRDGLVAKAWFDASEGVPATLPDVVVCLRFFEFRAAGADFTGKGMKRTYLARVQAGGPASVRKVVLDWAKGTVTVALTGVTLGTFEKGPVEVPFTLSLGTLSASDTLGAVCSGRSLKY